jgi:tetratricopeptide (TPR) repeat protein
MRWTLARVAVGMGLAQLLAGGVALTPAIASELSDQLSIKLYNGTRGNSRVEADRLVRLGNQQQQAGSSDKAIGSWLQALEIYHTIKEVEAEGTTYEALSKAYSQVGRFTEAEDAVRRSLAIARDTKNFQNQIYATNNLGTLLLQRASVSEAQKAFAEGFKVAKDINDSAGQGLSLSNLGLVAYAQGNYKNAIRYYEQAKPLREQASDPGVANTLNNLGDAYQAIRDYRTALVSYRQALFVSQNSLDRPSQFRALEGLTRAFYGLGQNSNASETLDRRLALALEQNDSKQVISALKSLAQFYKAKGDLTAADSYYQQAFAIAQGINDTQEQQGLLTQIGTLRSRKFIR